MSRKDVLLSLDQEADPGTAARSKLWSWGQVGIDHVVHFPFTVRLFFPPSQRVFKPHSGEFVESLTFIRDGIVWHRLMIDAQAIRPGRIGVRLARNQTA